MQRKAANAIADAIGTHLILVQSLPPTFGFFAISEDRALLVAP